jgi:Flp pilus assembly protein TadG
MGSGMQTQRRRWLGGSVPPRRWFTDSTVGVPRERTLRNRSDQSGQALVEFALIMPLFLMIVIGIASFGIGLKYWLDLNRLANEGARQAVVNYWPPYCALDDTACASSNGTTACSTVLAANSRARLHDVLRCKSPNNATTTICYPSTAQVGNPVRVKLAAPYRLFFMNSLGITLTATATMKIERPPTLIAGDPCV